MNNFSIGDVIIHHFKIRNHKMEIDALIALLSDDEVSRANKFVFDKDRNSYIICRGYLRKILSSYLNIDPKYLEFSYNKYGKPYIDNNPIKFNLSHSGDFCVLGISESQNIGIDIEKIDPSVNINSLLESILSKRELGHINKYPEDMKLDLFYDVWTQKESVIKANGKGLSFGLTHWSTEYPKSSYTIQIESNEYSIHKFEVDNEYKSALCIAVN